MKKLYAALAYAISGAILLSGGMIATAINVRAGESPYLMMAGLILMIVSGYLFSKSDKKV